MLVQYGWTDSLVFVRSLSHAVLISERSFLRVSSTAFMKVVCGYKSRWGGKIHMVFLKKHNKILFDYDMQLREHILYNHLPRFLCVHVNGWWRWNICECFTQSFFFLHFLTFLKHFAELYDFYWDSRTIDCGLIWMSLIHAWPLCVSQYCSQCRVCRQHTPCWWWNLCCMYLLFVRCVSCRWIA